MRPSWPGVGGWCVSWRALRCDSSGGADGRRSAGVDMRRRGGLPLGHRRAGAAVQASLGPQRERSSRPTAHRWGRSDGYRPANRERNEPPRQTEKGLASRLVEETAARKDGGCRTDTERKNGRYRTDTNRKDFVAQLPCDVRLPCSEARSSSASVFSGPAQRSLVLRPARSPSRLHDLLHRRLQRLGYPRRRFDCYRPEPGWTTLQLEDCAFSRRTSEVP